MSRYNPLGWQNQNGLSNYPLETAFEQQDFLTDARFVQFDGFVPRIDYVFVENNSIKLSITFDYGQNTNIEFFKSQYDQGEHRRHLKIYQPITDRYLGALCFGTGVEKLLSNSVGKKIAGPFKFDVTTVISIPSKDAVYTLDDMFGDITLSRTYEDKTIFYNNNSDLNTITFNAVSKAEISSGDRQGLRKINLVPPVNNNINLLANDTIKLSSLNASSLVVNLVTGTQQRSFQLSTLSS